MPAPTAPLDLDTGLHQALTILHGLMLCADKPTIQLAAARSFATLALKLKKLQQLEQQKQHDPKDEDDQNDHDHASAATMHRDNIGPSGVTPSDLTPTTRTPAPVSAPKRSRARASKTSSPPPIIKTHQVKYAPPHHPVPHPTLDHLWQNQFDPITTEPITDEEIRELNELHANLNQRDLRNNKYVLVWRFRLREARFWKEYWLERAKDPERFAAAFEPFLNPPEEKAAYALPPEPEAKSDPAPASPPTAESASPLNDISLTTLPASLPPA